MLCLSNTKRHTRVHLRCAQWGGSIIQEAWPVPAVETTLPLSSPSDQAHFWTPVTFTKTTQCQVPCFDKEEPCSGKHLTTLIIDIVCLSQSFIKTRFSWRKKNKKMECFQIEPSLSTMPWWMWKNWGNYQSPLWSGAPASLYYLSRQWANIHLHY